MRIVFIGTAKIALPALKSLLRSPNHEVAGVVTQPDQPVGRKQTLTPSPVKALAAGSLVPIFQPRRIREPTAIESIRYLRPDAIVVMAYGQILPRELLEIPPVACLNLHASLLPKHRGASPVHAAVLAGDQTSGVTVMYMDEGLDTGDILLQKDFPLSRHETAGSLHDRIATTAATAMLEALNALISNNAPRSPQDDAVATYAPKLNRESGRIDWSNDWRVIDRTVRGLNPWPGAFTTLPDDNGRPARKLKIHRVLPMARAHGEPGTVTVSGKRGPVVACGRGGVVLREVQPEGSRKMDATEFLHGHPLPPGTRLG